MSEKQRVVLDFEIPEHVRGVHHLHAASWSQLDNALIELHNRGRWWYARPDIRGWEVVFDSTNLTPAELLALVPVLLGIEGA